VVVVATTAACRGPRLAGPRVAADARIELTLDSSVYEALRPGADLGGLPGKVRLDRRGGHAEDALGLRG
jgi:hypothetical protein